MHHDTSVSYFPRGCRKEASLQPRNFICVVNFCSLGRHCLLSWICGGTCFLLVILCYNGVLHCTGTLTCVVISFNHVNSISNPYLLIYTYAYLFSWLRKCLNHIKCFPFNYVYFVISSHIISSYDITIFQVLK